jgi:hypothetical protein
MEEIAKAWEKGEQINKMPYYSSAFVPHLSQPIFVLHAAHGQNEDKTFSYSVSGRARTGNAVFGDNVIKFHDISKNIYPILWVYLTGGGDFASLGWKKDDGFRWALIDYDRAVLAQGDSMPDQGELQSLLKHHNVESLTDKIRRYNTEQGNLPGLDLRLAVDITNNNYAGIINNEKNAAPIDNDDITLWGETRRLLNRVLSEHPDLLVNIDPIFLRIYWPDVPVQSQMLKLLARPMLANLESLLERKPSSESLWLQWIFWKSVEGERRPMAPLAERIKLSPLSTIKDMLPPRIMQAYFNDCQNNGDWDRLIELLRANWDREFEELNAPENKNAISFGLSVRNLGDKLGAHLIEAYLNDNKPNAANEIFNAVLGCGSTFSDISKMAELARTKGQDRLAREWEDSVKKRR